MVQRLSPSGGTSRTEYDRLLDSLDDLKPKPLAPEVARLRSIKSKYEQKVMRQAADISARAHNKVSRIVTSPGFFSLSTVFTDHALYGTQHGGACRCGALRIPLCARWRAAPCICASRSFRVCILLMSALRGH